MISGFHPIPSEGPQGDTGPIGEQGDAGDDTELFWIPGSVLEPPYTGLASAASDRWWTLGTDWSATNGSTSPDGAPLGYRRRDSILEFRGGIVAGRGTEIFKLPFRFVPNPGQPQTGPFDDYDIGFVNGNMSPGEALLYYPAIAVDTSTGDTEPCVILIRGRQVIRQGGPAADRLIVGWEAVSVDVGPVDVSGIRSPFPGKSLGYPKPLARAGAPKPVVQVPPLVPSFLNGA